MEQSNSDLKISANCNITVVFVSRKIAMFYFRKCRCISRYQILKLHIQKLIGGSETSTKTKQNKKEVNLKEKLYIERL